MILLGRIRLRRLASYDSPILGKVEVFQKYNGEKVLTTNSFPQGISTEQPSIKYSYWYKIANEAFRYTKNIKNPQVLCFGLGANTSSLILAKLNPKIQQTIIEIDAQIIQACKDYFQLNDLIQLTLIQADAFKVIDSGSQLPNNHYDAIIVDIFLSSPPYIDKKSNTPIFIKKLLTLLKPKGMVIFNRPSHNQEARRAGIELKKELDKYFQTSQLFDIKDPRGYRNNVITASFKL